MMSIVIQQGAVIFFFWSKSMLVDLLVNFLQIVNQKKFFYVL